VGMVRCDGMLTPSDRSSASDVFGASAFAFHIQTREAGAPLSCQGGSELPADSRSGDCRVGLDTYNRHCRIEGFVYSWRAILPHTQERRFAARLAGACSGPW